VLRGLVSALQAAATARLQLPGHPALADRAAPRLAAILALLAGDLGRPLPPLDWGFLEPLLQDAALHPAAVDLLARQAATSRTARTLVEAHLGSDQVPDALIKKVDQNTLGFPVIS
jgi:hypothetical protein